MNQSTSTCASWRSSTSMIFWGVLSLTIFGCAASFCEFFFGIIDTAREWIDMAFKSAATLDVQTHAEGFFKFYAVHGRLALWTRTFEVLTICGWIAYVVGLSKFRQAQSAGKGRWLTGSLYSACWLGLVAIACAFIGSFLGLFGLLFRFIGWVLNLISLFKFRGAFNRLSIEESWDNLAQRGAGNLCSSYTFGIILAFYPIIVFLTVLFIGLGSISSFSNIANSFANEGMNAVTSMIGGLIVFVILLALVSMVLWICQVCYLISGWCKIKDGSLAESTEKEYQNDNSTIMTLCAIFCTIILMGLVAWSCISPLTEKNASYSISKNNVEDVSFSEETEHSEENETPALTDVHVDEQVESNEEVKTMDETVSEEYTHNYKGTINNQHEIEMTLTNDGSVDYTGEYSYTQNRQPIQLRGQMTDGDGHLVLEEYVGMNMTGKFEGTLNAKGYSGVWTSADGEKSYPFSVTKK